MILKKFELGVVYNSEGKVINHRSLLKVFINPFLRLFGYNIATLYDMEKNKLLKPVLIPCNKKQKINFMYDNNGNYYIERRRMII